MLKAICIALTCLLLCSCCTTSEPDYVRGLMNGVYLGKQRPAKDLEVELRRLALLDLIDTKAEALSKEWVVYIDEPMDREVAASLASHRAVIGGVDESEVSAHQYVLSTNFADYTGRDAVVLAYYGFGNLGGEMWQYNLKKTRQGWQISKSRRVLQA